MARAETPTLLSLDRFAQLVGINPLHWNQAALAIEASEDTALDQANCGKVIVQYPWQADDALSREEAAIAIATAEANMAEYLGYDVAPKWNRDELILGVQGRMGSMLSVNNLFMTDRGYVLAGGVEAKTFIDTGAVEYTDLDGDNYKETATISVMTALEDASEIALYYPGHNGDDAWEIRPIKVSIDLDVTVGGEHPCTITCGRHQLVNEALFMAIREVQVADGDEDEDFLTSADVYRHYTDTAQQAYLLWRTKGQACGCIPPTTCVLCSEVGQDACIGIQNPRLGHIRLYSGTWNTETLAFDSSALSVWRSPDKVRLSYRAGYTEHGRLAAATGGMGGMSRIFERAVTLYALALMDRPICGCAGITAKHENARADLSESGDTSFGGERVWSESKFGTRRGAVEAWHLVETMAIGR